MLDVSKLTPVAFHCYPAVVQDRLFRVEYDSKSEINTLENSLLELFREKGIKDTFDNEIRRDNKIVFEVLYHSVRVFYGFKDWMFSIGLDYRRM